MLIDGRPVLFDAIEFDDRIATGDVFYDLAFLVMDLIERGFSPKPQILCSTVIWADTQRLHDLEALAALPFFMSVRAAIRAKVTARAAGAARRHAQASSKARAPISRWPASCWRRRRRMLLAVGGLSGTGKSLLARALARRNSARAGRGGAAQRRRAQGPVRRCRNRPLAARRPTRATSRHRSMPRSPTRRGACVAAGHSAIVDAVFADAGERAAIAQAAPAGAFHGLFLTADLATRIARVGGRKGDASDADAAVARQQEQYDLGAHAMDAG